MSSLGYCKKHGNIKYLNIKYLPLNVSRGHEVGRLCIVSWNTGLLFSCSASPPQWLDLSTGFAGAPLTWWPVITGQSRCDRLLSHRLIHFLLWASQLSLNESEGGNRFDFCSWFTAIYKILNWQKLNCQWLFFPRTRDLHCFLSYNDNKGLLFYSLLWVSISERLTQNIISLKQLLQVCFLWKVFSEIWNIWRIFLVFSDFMKRLRGFTRLHRDLSILSSVFTHSMITGPFWLFLSI